MSDQTESNRNAFSQKLTDILNYGALNLAMGLGYRVRLFDVMDTLETPQPVSIISGKAGLNERYVQEWLGIMVTGGIVDLCKDQKGQDLFHLPKAHADLITRRAENDTTNTDAPEARAQISGTVDATRAGPRGPSVAMPIE